MIQNSDSNEICYIFCKACSCCTASTSVAKPALNEYILVALITDLDKKKRRKKQTQCKELYIYKTTTTIFFLFIVKCMKYNN